MVGFLFYFGVVNCTCFLKHSHFENEDSYRFSFSQTCYSVQYPENPVIVLQKIAVNVEPRYSACFHINGILLPIYSDAYVTLICRLNTGQLGVILQNYNFLLR